MPALPLFLHPRRAPWAVRQPVEQFHNFAVAPMDQVDAYRARVAKTDVGVKAVDERVNQQHFLLRSIGCWEAR